MSLYVDCTDTFYSGRNTGIQRVVRNFVRHAMSLGRAMDIKCVPIVFRKGEMVQLTGSEVLRVHLSKPSIRHLINNAYIAITRHLASLFPIPAVQRFLLAHRSQFGLARILYAPVQIVFWIRYAFCSNHPPPNEISVTPMDGDILFLPDATWTIDIFEKLATLKQRNVRIVFFIHDIIPLTHPEFFQPAHVTRFEKWFHQITEIADLLIFNSLFTQASVKDYLGMLPDKCNIDGAVVYLGYDISSNIFRHDPTHLGLSKTFSGNPDVFLCVGTLEPRKNLDVVLDAFDRLWSNDYEISLVLIGRAGWQCESLLRRIRTHRERGYRLFWFDDVDDANLLLAYQRARGLILSSVVEGFGLPMIEALSQGLPVIASDIPVFREIAGNHARYFDPKRSDVLANEVLAVLSHESDHRNEEPFVWPSWEDSSRELLTVLQRFLGDNSRFVPHAAPQPSFP